MGMSGELWCCRQCGRTLPISDPGLAHWDTLADGSVVCPDCLTQLERWQVDTDEIDTAAEPVPVTDDDAR